MWKFLETWLFLTILLWDSFPVSSGGRWWQTEQILVRWIMYRFDLWPGASWKTSAPSVTDRPQDSQTATRYQASRNLATRNLSHSNYSHLKLAIQCSDKYNLHDSKQVCPIAVMHSEQANKGVNIESPPQCYSGNLSRAMFRLYYKISEPTKEEVTYSINYCTHVAVDVGEGRNYRTGSLPCRHSLKISLRIVSLDELYVVSKMMQSCS